MSNERTGICILGAGQIGTAIARGLAAAGVYEQQMIILTRRRAEALIPLAEEGFRTTTDNREAVRRSDVVLIAVPPGDTRALLGEIASVIDPARHVVISVVTGVTIADIAAILGVQVPIVRAMPNTAIAIQESMTCIAVLPETSPEIRQLVRAIFATVGKTAFIHEDLMLASTALCACGTAFFLRCIRAASQGGVEIGFHAGEALELAAQTALGAAKLLLQSGTHPEQEIDKVTTPRGITISGLNQMEHHGFSSAMIHGIVVAAEKAARLFNGEE